MISTFLRNWLSSYFGVEIEKTMKTSYLIPLVILFFFSSTNVFSQETYKISSESKMYVHGTSTLHDWTSNVEDFNGQATISLNGKLKDINTLTMKAKVESIESGKGKMNSLTYEALKSETHPYITFSLDDIKKLERKNIIASGFVTIAGVKKSIEVAGTYSLIGQQLEISGSKDINMKDFNIEPPTAIFGTIVVGEVVNIEYDLILNK